MSMMLVGTKIFKQILTIATFPPLIVFYKKKVCNLADGAKYFFIFQKQSTRGSAFQLFKSYFDNCLHVLLVREFLRAAVWVQFYTAYPFHLYTGGQLELSLLCRWRMCTNRAYPKNATTFSKNWTPLKSIADWSELNGVKLNPKKAEV